MADAIVVGAQSAVKTLKAAQETGKQLGSVIADQQSDMEKAVQQQHIQRMKAKAEQEYLATMAEFKAYEKYQKEKALEEQQNEKEVYETEGTIIKESETPALKKKAASKKKVTLKLEE